MLRMQENRSVRQIKIRFVTALDRIKYLKQIKCHTLILTCAPFSELPSNMSTMVLTVRSIYLLVAYQFTISMSYIWSQTKRLTDYKDKRCNK